MDTTVSLLAPAKVNLTLDIKGPRPDGYHELETIMHQVNLVDTVHLRRLTDGIEVSTDSPLVPGDSDNLAYRAAVEFFQATGIAGGVDIHIEKHIPVGAGLAGGSTDAAAVIKGLNRLYAAGLDIKDQMVLGARIGSDIPFCILGGTALARGRGEILTPLSPARNLLMVLAKPGYSVSTREVYARYDQGKVTRRPDTGGVEAALASGNLAGACAGMENVLETVTLECCPEVALLKQMMTDLGAVKALMSGSGPTVFGIFLQREVAEAACAIINRYYEEVFIVTSFERG